jgi:hypothetical protein
VGETKGKGKEKADWCLLLVDCLDGESIRNWDTVGK